MYIMELRNQPKAAVGVAVGGDMVVIAVSMAGVTLLLRLGLAPPQSCGGRAVF